jgi:Glyoxalase-like domain
MDDAAPLARWQDLCIDATDAGQLGAFWAKALTLEPEQLNDGDVVLREAGRPERTLWVNRVPEPRTVKQRVHLDLRAGSLQPLLDAGATVLRPEGDDGIRWTVMADPEGGELCVFLRPELAPDAPILPFEMAVDSADHAAQARWWAEVLGGTVTQDGRDFTWIEDVPGLPFDSIDFVPVPEPKTVKNRIHWDVTASDVGALVAAGATVLREPDDEIHWHVLADPEGNEFCVFAPDEPGAPEDAPPAP